MALIAAQQLVIRSSRARRYG